MLQNIQVPMRFTFSDKLSFNNFWVNFEPTTFNHDGLKRPLDLN